MEDSPKTYAFVDAANLFYGGKKSLGWSIDHEKLHLYLKERYNASRIYYFGGVEIYNFPFDYLAHDTVPIKEVEQHLIQYIKDKNQYLTDARLTLIDRHLKRIRFYNKVEQFGFHLVLKPIKTYEDDDGNTKRKANCDVDMAFYLMRERDEFERVIVLSGDGDFLPVLKHLKEAGKEVLILARAPRTAKEIKRFAAERFMDFEYLRERLKRDQESEADKEE
jgi:uncharacterized LabA/DUF88 family protein